MDLHNIKKVEVVRHTEQVNKMLADGWILLKVREDDCFVLGTENPDAVVPEPKKAWEE